MKTLQALEAPQPRFKNEVALPNSRGVKWVKPLLVAEVEYRGWTTDNLLRQASFKGLREDKDPAEITRELPQMSSVRKDAPIPQF